MSASATQGGHNKVDKWTTAAEFIAVQFVR